MSKELPHQSHTSDQADYIASGSTRLETAARWGLGLLVAAIAVGSVVRIIDEPSEPFSLVDVSPIKEFVFGDGMPSTSK